jgi:hypothetical protein
MSRLTRVLKAAVAAAGLYVAGRRRAGKPLSKSERKAARKAAVAALLGTPSPGGAPPDRRGPG